MQFFPKENLIIRTRPGRGKSYSAGPVYIFTNLSDICPRSNCDVALVCVLGACGRDARRCCNPALLR